jgi:redox-sensitive bicupin YhaK (pirin superfamily)
VERLVRARRTSDGAGVLLWRSIGTAELDHLDPFLLLDEFRSDRPDDYLAGFPDHPHRGFETVTYMLAGAMQHRDHAGHEGNLVAGSLQWMTAGRGIVHSEMPRQERGLVWGFQLWVNLPARLKMCAPRYQEIPPDAVPERVLAGGVRVRVLAGESGGVRGPVEGIATAPTYLDVGVPAGATFETELRHGDTAFCYVFQGDAHIGGAGAVGSGTLAVLGVGEALSLSAGDAGARLLFCAATPLGEPIARYGPFVMTTREQILEAIRDYEAGRLATRDPETP